jgi:hypothetical protein
MSIMLLFIAPVACMADTFARVSYIEGDVQVRFADSDEWEPASLNMPVSEGDSVWTSADGRFELQLPNGAVARFDRQSQLDLVTLTESYHQLHLESGRIYVVTPRELAASLQVDVDDTTVLPFARSRMRIDALENGVEDVSIFSGAAYVESRGQRTKVRGGEQMLLDNADNPIYGLNPPDEWERWNSLRGKRSASKGESEQILPPELKANASEFDANGTWVDSYEYGMIWRPTVVIGASWAPYQVGRWVWRNNDYYWVGSEPWGWAPYHYGRWVVLPGRGWFWVPPRKNEVVFRGAHVAWVQADSHIGWVPLAPGELTSAVSSVSGRATVNLSTSYRNYRAPGGVTYINKAHFGTRGAVPVSQPKWASNPVLIDRPPVMHRPAANKYQRAPVLPAAVRESNKPQGFNPAAQPPPGRAATQGQPFVPPQRGQQPTFTPTEQLKARFPKVVQPQPVQQPKPATVIPKTEERPKVLPERLPESRNNKPPVLPAATKVVQPQSQPQSVQQPRPATVFPKAEERSKVEPERHVEPKINRPAATQPLVAPKVDRKIDDRPTVHQPERSKEQREQKDGRDTEKERKGWMLREKQ